MAAKSTKSPESFSKPNKNNNNHRTPNGGISNAISNLCKNFSSEQLNTETNDSYPERTPTTITTNNDDDKSTIIGKISNCDCTNISIMHLFHEMKQEFPTIPDQIVAQHVNENCHQRENCLKLLRTELALHPSPVQSFPAKVLQQLQQSPKKPSKPFQKSPVSPLTTTPTATKSSSSNTSTNAPATGGVWPLKYSRLLKNGQSEQLNNHEEHEQEQQILLPESPRLRPTTLNLFPLPQQQQFRNVQVQLKEQLQQRNQQQHQKSLEKSYQEQTPMPKERQPLRPVRRAPLPPLPPKPTHLQNISPVHMQQNGNMKITKTLADDPAAVLSDLPLLPSTTVTSAINKKSPMPIFKVNDTINSEMPRVRHRAVLHMNPQKSVVRTFISNSLPTSPVNNNAGQKSFTSVNLTLRQPVASIPQSTIDIVAGPGVSAAGGSGLTYSSTSYNAQQGYQKTFNITVSDEGSEISASRIRSPNSGTPNSIVNNPIFLIGEKSPSQDNDYRNKWPKSLTACDYQDYMDILELQKARRDKLAAALRENKNKLHQMEQKINILTEPFCTDETTKLDNEIQQLRTACESMLNEIENVRRLDNNHQTIGSDKNRALQDRSITQKYNITPSTPSTTLSTSVLSDGHDSNSMQQQHHLLYSRTEISYTDSTSEEDYDDDGEDEDDSGANDDEDVLEMWACNMCTFRNHPQLNICECCENVRILPGTIRIVTTATTTSTTTNTPTNNTTNDANNSNSLENNSNLTQLALHT